jgi:aspartyl-tRNA(Asn)/glutamyl-tRNA(Gln) amidotransferase subunit A
MANKTSVPKGLGVAEQGLIQPRLNVSSLTNAFRQGSISQAEFTTRLVSLGFSSSVIDILLKSECSAPGKKLTKKERMRQLPSTITEAGKRLRNGSLTALKLCKIYLDGIKELQSQMNAFITITEEEALATAAALDVELQAGTDRGFLHGIPVVYKDNFDTLGVRTTMGSEYFLDRVPQDDAAVVQLLRVAGTVCLGKTNLNEFASERTGQNKFFGDIHNPWDLSRSPGGSSGGTAAAIAGGLCLGGMGTDTGSSVRCPAGWCGIVGLRPTYGLISIAGVFPRSSSFDTAGPLGHSVTDVALLLDAVAGYDPRDSISSLNQVRGTYTRNIKKGVRGLRLGFIKNYSFRDVDPEIHSAIEAAGNTFAALGAEIEIVEIPFLENPLEWTVLPTMVDYEFNQILGDRYRTAKNKDVFGRIVQDSITNGMQVSKETYERAKKKRPWQIAQVKEAFKKVDALLTPSLPMVAPLLTADREIFKRAGQFMTPTALTYVPAISIPCGFSSEGLPIGLQIAGNHFEESLILRVAASFEAATDFHQRRPPVYWGQFSFP